MEKFVAQQNDYLFGAFEPLLTKLPIIGDTQIKSTFECPTNEDMKKFPLDHKIKLSGIAFKVDYELKGEDKALKGIQLQFTNDVETPMFQTKWGDQLISSEIMIDQNKPIRMIGLLLSNRNTIRGIRLLGESGEVLIDQVWLDMPTNKWVMREVPFGQEIIGLYGSLTSGQANAYIQSLGFITWVPNPHAKDPKPITPGEPESVKDIKLPKPNAKGKKECHIF